MGCQLLLNRVFRASLVCILMVVSQKQLFAELDFANLNSSFVLPSNRGRIKIGSNTSIKGWDEFSIRKDKGNDNSWIATNAVIGYQAGDTAPDNHLIENNSNAILGLGANNSELIAGNSNTILTMLPYLRTNSTAIINIDDRVTTNATGIQTNVTNINTNANNITTNGNNITTNANDITTLQNRATTDEFHILANSRMVQANSNAIATYFPYIINNSGSITSLKTRVTSNDTDIASNQFHILANSTLVGANSRAISTLTPYIFNNSGSITSLKTRIDSNIFHIRANSNLLYSNSQSIVSLDSRVTTNETGIQTNVTNINNNANNITTNGNNITTNANNITTNANDITTLQNRATTDEFHILANSRMVQANSNAIATYFPYIRNNSNTIISLSSRADLDEQMIRGNSAYMTIIDDYVFSNSINTEALRTRNYNNERIILANSNLVYANSQHLITLDNFVRGTFNLPGWWADYDTLSSNVVENHDYIVGHSGQLLSINTRASNWDGYIRSNSGRISSLETRTTLDELMIRSNSAYMTTVDTVVLNNSISINSLDERASSNEFHILANSNLVYANSQHLITLDNFVRGTFNLPGWWADYDTLSSNVVENHDYIVNNSNAMIYQRTHFSAVNDGKLYAVGGISGETIVPGRGILNSPINLNGATLTNGGDLLFSSGTTIESSGYWNPGGNAYVLGSDLKIPANVTLTFTGDGILDGQGHTLILQDYAQIHVDGNISVTIKNMKIKNSINTPLKPPLSVVGFRRNPGVSSAQGSLTLDNVKMALNNDWTFSWGQLFIHDEVVMSGTSEFVYSSTFASFIEPNSTLHFNPKTSFYYNQQNSDNMNLFIMQGETSGIFLDGCTLRTTDTGLRLTKGRLWLDNKVTLSTYSRRPETFANALIFGDSASGADYDLDVYVLGGARVETDGYVWYDSVN